MNNILNPNTPTHHAAFDENNDYLNYKDYAEAIYSQITKMKFYNTGITFGVLAEWGMGKTTVLNLLSERLKTNKSSVNGIIGKFQVLFAEKPFVVIRFDAWQYIRQEELWLALIRKITNTFYLEKSISKVNLYKRIWQNRLVKNPKLYPSIYKYIILILAFTLLTLISFIGLNYLLDNLYFFNTALDEIGIDDFSIGPFTIGITKWTIVLLWVMLVYRIGQMLIFEQLTTNLPSLTKTGFDKGQGIDIDDFKDDFYAMLQSVGENKTVVVLIDDLDRCSPNQIVPVLEAIKHLGFDGSDFASKSDMAKIAFVLAIDPTAVEHALAGYFKDYFQGAEKEKDIYQFAKNYIAKIIQVPIILPPLSEGQLRKMLKEVVKK